MILDTVQTTLHKIQNPRLQLPIFYESPFALRFEIGDEQIQNQNIYIRQALWRVLFLYQQIPTPDTLLWVLYRTEHTTTPIAKLLAQFCNICQLPEPEEVYEQQTVDRDGEDFTRIFCFWDLTKISVVDIHTLFECILRADIDGFLELTSAVFLFHTQQHILFHLYDDRGLDIVASNKQDIQHLYDTCQNWLLDYDKPRMNKIFQK